MNKDFPVVAWGPGRGLHELGQGKDLESALAIVRLHPKSEDYVDFTGVVDVVLTLKERQVA